MSKSRLTLEQAETIEEHWERLKQAAATGRKPRGVRMVAIAHALELLQRHREGEDVFTQPGTADEAENVPLEA